MSRGKLTRREFTAGTTALGALALAAGRSGAAMQSARPDIVSVRGDDARANVKKALDEMGGIGTFVQAGQTVGLLTNTIGRVHGAVTSPDMISAVAAICKEAGAADVRMIDWRDQSRLKQNGMIKLLDDPNLTYMFIDPGKPELWKEIEIPRGKALTKVRVGKAFYDVDVLITMPIMKDHRGANYTGCLKLFMGVTHNMDNRIYFHREGEKHLEQCIADLNSAVRPADLIVMDCMEVLTTNGPGGPGNLTAPKKVVVGTDPVAVDAYAMPILGVDPKTSVQLTGAFAHGVGEMDLSKLTIREI